MCGAFSLACARSMALLDDGLTMLPIIIPHQLVIIPYHLPIRLKIGHLRPLVVSCSIHPDLHGARLLQVGFASYEFRFLASMRFFQGQAKG